MNSLNSIVGDVVALNSGDNGSTVKVYVYDAFGVEKNINSSDTNVFRYCGEYYDKETGAIYLRARYYNPSTGRFLTKDPARDGLNWYVYCENNPILRVDPSGMISLEDVGDWFKKTSKTVADGAVELGKRSLDAFEGFGNACDEILFFGSGNAVRGWLGIDAYEPYYNDSYNIAHFTGQATSVLASAGMFLEGMANLGTLAGNLSNGGKVLVGVNATQKLVGGSIPIVSILGEAIPTFWGGINIILASRGGNLKPDPNANGQPHTTYGYDENGNVNKYTEWTPNDKNPTGFDEGKMYHGDGATHHNKVTGKEVGTPHVHDPNTPGGVRAPYPDEIPK